jgi:hypothetical protein
MTAKSARSDNQDPTPEIPAVDSQPTSGEEYSTTYPDVNASASVVAPAAIPPQPRQQRQLAPVAPRAPIQKEIRVIRVKTVDGVNVIINAHDYDPEMHTPLSEDDKKWGEMAVKARIAANDQREQEAYIKRLVRGRGL